MEKGGKKNRNQQQQEKKNESKQKSHTNRFYFSQQKIESFYPQVTVAFTVRDAAITEPSLIAKAKEERADDRPRFSQADDDRRGDSDDDRPRA